LAPDDRAADGVRQVTIGAGEAREAGRGFLLFGNGTLTACKPISNSDLGNYLADCLDDPTRHNRILPVGGPCGAISRGS